MTKVPFTRDDFIAAAMEKLDQEWIRDILENRADGKIDIGELEWIKSETNPRKLTAIFPYHGQILGIFLGLVMEHSIPDMESKCRMPHIKSHRSSNKKGVFTVYMPVETPTA